MKYIKQASMILLCSMGLLLSNMVTAKPLTSKPNLIIIVADDLGYADLSFLEQAPADVKTLQTPAIDRLAREGTFFSNAYATAPICSPSRCGLITGRYQQRWGNYWYGQGGLPSEETTLPQALKRLGYHSKKIGKTHLNGGPARHPLDHGFDEFLGFQSHTWDYIRLSQKDLDAYRQRAEGKPLGMLYVGPLQKDRGEPVSYENEFTTDVFTDEAIEFIRRDRDNKPFYIELEYNAVHMPTYVTHETWARKVGIDPTPWDRNAEAWTFPYWDPRKESWGSWHKQWGHLGKVDPLGRKRYLSHLIAMDSGIGQILDALDKTDQRDNTIIVFVSDNGGTINTYSNNTPLRGYKYMFGEGGIRVPMLISFPGRLPQGQTCNALVSAMDIYPTVMELAGRAGHSKLDGKTLVPLLTGQQTGDNHAALCWARGPKNWTIRKGPWKLGHQIGWNHLNFKIVDGLCVRDTDDSLYPDGTVLFNLKDDIGETTNLADRHPEIVEELTELYEEWHREMVRDKASRPKKPKRKQK